MDVPRSSDQRVENSAGRPTVAPVPPANRSLLRAVALPAEHGGWSLTLEPVLLGLIVSWSAAGACLGAAAVVAFLARTPLKLVLVDARRNRVLPRTRLARRVLGVEAAAMAALTAVAVLSGAPAFWAPLVVIGPPVGIELWFDMRSKSRRLVPELAGAVGIGGVVAVVALAGGSSTRLAAACWLILAARSITGIVTVRDLVGQLHGRASKGRLVLTGELVAVAVVGAAVLVDRATAAGAVSVVAAIAIQRGLSRRPAPNAVVIGVGQTLIGLGVVLATAIGVLST